MNNACVFCGKVINNKGSLTSHQKRCINNPNKVVFKTNSWNRGLTKENDHRILESSLKKSITMTNKCSSIEYLHHQKGKPRTPEEKKKISDSMKRVGAGGYRRGSGRGKKGWYKDIYCDSSWELAFILYCEHHSIPVVRCNDRRLYDHEGTEHTYLPDFQIFDDVIEIKGYASDQWKSKARCNPDVVVFMKDDMQPIIDFVSEMYGKNFIDKYRDDTGGYC